MVIDTSHPGIYVFNSSTFYFYSKYGLNNKMDSIKINFYYIGNGGVFLPSNIFNG